MNNDNFYLFISSKDSLSFHPDNEGSNFIVELPESVNLYGDWEIALCDFYHNQEVNEILYVFCDLCVSSNYYINVNNKTINRIKVYIRDVTFGLPSSITGDIHLTLQFRRKHGNI